MGGGHVFVCTLQELQSRRAAVASWAWRQQRCLPSSWSAPLLSRVLHAPVQAAPPSLGIGRIKARDNPALYGTDREHSLRTPDDPFYKRFSAEASRQGGGVCCTAGAPGAQQLVVQRTL